MSVTERLIPAPAGQVFAVLADGWTYADWVVGTAHVRAVDADWPAVGSHLHHRVGPWPLSISDRSTVLDRDDDRMLRLRVRIWPLGAGEVLITLEPRGDRTLVRIHETFVDGPLQKVHNAVNDLLLHRRNAEALRRLADLVVNRRLAAQRG